MDIFAPSYYKEFKCIANRCKHSCCIGWEIDIDKETLEFYSKQPQIAKNIKFCKVPHFILGRDKRCPFLNGENLCDIIINYGQEKLCQICTDHPRFVNSYNSRQEIGIGLTCEAAVRLILERDFKLEKIDNDQIPAITDIDEDDFFEFREQLFNKDVSSLKNLLSAITYDELFASFNKFERLDKTWDNLLNTLCGKNKKLADLKIKDVKIANRLFCYFLFRYLCTYGIEFCVFCTYFILCIDYDVYETARMFSSEIEYSDENCDKILNLIS